MFYFSGFLLAYYPRERSVRFFSESKIKTPTIELTKKQNLTEKFYTYIEQKCLKCYLSIK